MFVELKKTAADLVGDNHKQFTAKTEAAYANITSKCPEVFGSLKNSFLCLFCLDLISSGPSP